MKYDKIIWACNNDDCAVEYLHILVVSPAIEAKYTDDVVECTACGQEMTFCEIISEAGDL